MRFSKPQFLILTPCFLLAGCTLDVPDPEAKRHDFERPFQSAVAQKQAPLAIPIANAQNAFGLRLLRLMGAEKPRKNVFISPTSVFEALAMARAGAGGASKNEIGRVLNFPAKNGEASLKALNALFAAQGAQIDIANAIWADKKTPFSAAFTKSCAQTFGAQAQTLDFRAPGAEKPINDWVSGATQGKISDWLQPGSLAGQSAVLTNAVYFKGRWQTPFDKSQTKDGTFHAPDGDKTLPMMSRTELVGISGPNVKGVRLPYENSTCEMWLLLPSAGQTPLGVVQKLDWDKREAYEQIYVSLQLPRFTLDFGDSLNKPLQKMGMKTVFSRADLTPMGLPPNSFLARVIHKTRLEVDEEGTVAAAATEVGVAAADKPEILIFNRPFVVLVAERQSGALLFAGIVNDPQSS